jgi:hypothetical protein
VCVGGGVKAQEMEGRGQAGGLEAGCTVSTWFVALISFAGVSFAAWFAAVSAGNACVWGRGRGVREGGGGKEWTGGYSQGPRGCWHSMAARTLSHSCHINLVCDCVICVLLRCSAGSGGDGGGERGICCSQCP